MTKYMLAGLLVVLAVTPFAVRADSYDGPYCYEDPKEEHWSVDENRIRGTCKVIGPVIISVALDPSLQDQYFLGHHDSIKADCQIDGCSVISKYSEKIRLVSGSVITESANELGSWDLSDPPVDAAIFEKSVFVPKLKKLFETANISFSEKMMPDVFIHVFKKSELDELIKADSSNEYKYSGRVMDTLLNSPDDGFHINTLNYTDYGRGIYGIKTNYGLIESHYVDLEKNYTALTEKDLQMTPLAGRRGGFSSQYTVPITSPLKTVKNYWIFTKKDGKLVLAWQKSEYTLDDGSVKTVTPADKNVSAALLFGGKATATTTTPAATQPTPVVPVEKGFFASFFAWLFWWL